jgi:hypothetical protein
MSTPTSTTGACTLPEVSSIVHVYWISKDESSPYQKDAIAVIDRIKHFKE